MPKEVFRDRRGDWSYTELAQQKGEVDVEHTVSLALELSWGIESMVHIGSVNQVLIEERGWFVELDRESINRLIKSLRKARDQAFGEDA